MALTLNDMVAKVYSEPHYASEKQVRNVMHVLNAYERGELRLTERPLTEREDEINYDAENNLGVLQVRGVLSNEESGWDSFCGITSYERLKGEFDLLVQKKIKTLVLEVDSGGGEAYGCFETAMYVKEKAKENDIKILTYVDGLAASAAYAWAAIADEVVINPQAEVGSIGVVIRLRNNKKNEFTYIYAGDSKIPYDEEGKFTEAFKEDMQSKIDFLYEDFIKHVSDNRNISIESVKNTQAKTFLRDDALSLGLADTVKTKEEFKQYVLSLKQEKRMGIFNNTSKPSQEVEQDKPVELSQIEKDLADKTLELENVKTTFQSEIENLTSELSNKDNEVKSLQEELNKFKTEAKTQERKASLQAVFGTEAEEVDEYLKEFADVSDGAFTLMVKGLTKNKAETKEEMKEVGSNVTQPQEDKTFAQILSERAKQTKTAKGK